MNDFTSILFFFEEPSMVSFYATPYAMLRTQPRKAIRMITPSLCAQKCLKEEGFVCRSFNYLVSTVIIKMFSLKKVMFNALRSFIVIHIKLL